MADHPGDRRSPAAPTLGRRRGDLGRSSRGQRGAAIEGLGRGGAASGGALALLVGEAVEGGGRDEDRMRIFPADHGRAQVALRERPPRQEHHRGPELGWLQRAQVRRDDRDLLLGGSVKNAKFDKDVRLQISDLNALGAGLPTPPLPRFSTMVQDGHRYLMVRYSPDFRQSEISNLKSSV